MVTAMPSKLSELSSQEASAIVRAIDLSHAMIEFDLDGRVLWCNDLFCEAMGYTAEELVGQPHSMFVSPSVAASDEYREFWNTLRSGESLLAEFRRVGKGGKEVWLQASYSPVLDTAGRPIRVIKVATDIARAKRLEFASTAIVDAIERSMAVIEFLPDGAIVRANERFLSALGYQATELAGAHHRIFLPAVEAGSAAYREFWRSLAAGEVVAGQFQRLAKDGHSVWLEATYNPVFDEQGQVVRVVKIAIDITDKVLAAHEVAEKSVALERALQRGREAEIQRTALDSALQELSTPVIPIWEGVLLLPLIGIVDSTRTEDILRKTLDKVNTTQAKIFILDISGVPVVDTAVADQLLKITRATRLMGCETVISGLSPAIARTIVELGVDTRGVRMMATLRDALRIGVSESSATRQ